MRVRFYNGDKLLVNVEMKEGEFIKDYGAYTVFTGKRIPALYRGIKQVKYDRVEVDKC